MEMMKDSEISVREAGNIIEETTSNIELVYEASNKITDITKIIEGIASQTNILALNASVEAARAGEQGKGFAIVASEVRNLAQTSQSSVKNITLLIEDSNKKIKTAAETARKSLEIFRLIEEKITNTSKIMQDISSMAVEQQQGVYQVNTAITQFSNNFYTAVRPQVTKYYAQNDLVNMFKLVFRSSKMTYYLLLLISLPIVVEAPIIIDLWLGQRPEYDV